MQKRNAHSIEVLECPNHPEVELIEEYHAGDMICSQCGLIVGDRVINVASEWRTFSNDKSTKDNSRVGSSENPLLHKDELSTGIAIAPRAAVDGEMGYLNKMNRSSMGGQDRSLIRGFKEISTMADRISLPRTIVDRTNVLFKQVDAEKHLKGRSSDAIAAACLYIACRQEGVPRTFKEICAVSKVSKKEIGRCFKLILRALETSVDLVQTSDFMSRFCANLGLSSDIQRAANHIARKAVELEICPGRVYTSVAAAAIYMASQASTMKKFQKEVGSVVGVAETTIRAIYRLIYPERAKLFPENFKFAVPLEKLPSV
ncbi:transcription initiation factor IIB-like [Oscarella lobularis]|uniref:transcription initiation factor IIB-like n=1 Tax=Oscarella lobularis TaxID=121494 RepID=UPI00331312FF